MNRTFVAHFTRAKVGVYGTQFGTVRLWVRCVVTLHLVRHTTHIPTLPSESVFWQLSLFPPLQSLNAELVVGFWRRIARHSSLRMRPWRTCSGDLMKESYKACQMMPVFTFVDHHIFSLKVCLVVLLGIHWVWCWSSIPRLATLALRDGVGVWSCARRAYNISCVLGHRLH